MMKINSAKFVTSAVRRSQYPNDKKCEFLLVGRSNVGKSSFINKIVNRKNIARTSALPGKTQTLNFYLINDLFYLVDVPGYGFAKVQKSLKKKFGMIIEEYLESREELQMVFMLVDFRHKPTDDDVLMYNYLKYYNIPVLIVATKYDKVKTSNRDKTLKTIATTLELKDTDKIVYFSSVTKKGRDEIYDLIEERLKGDNE